MSREVELRCNNCGVPFTAWVGPGDEEAECPGCDHVASLPLPVALREDTLTLFGVTLRVAVLDNGQRVINADDINALFMAMANGQCDDMSNADVRRLAEFMRGGKVN